MDLKVLAGAIAITATADGVLKQFEGKEVKQDVHSLLKYCSSNFHYYAKQSDRYEELADNYRLQVMSHYLNMFSVISDEEA